MEGYGFGEQQGGKVRAMISISDFLILNFDDFFSIVRKGKISDGRIRVRGTSRARALMTVSYWNLMFLLFLWSSLLPKRLHMPSWWPH